jgi:hypothetical protein
MIIYDKKNKKVLNSVTLYLTPDEMAELSDDAQNLSENPQNHHSHINDETLENEITLAVYTKENMKQFDEESKELILKKIKK